MHFVDLHTHVLPGIDDGAQSLGETFEMLRIAHAGGTRRVVATPHMYHPLFRSDPVEVEALFAHTAAELERRSEDPAFAFLREMTVNLGSENFISAEFLVALSQGRVLPLNGGSCLLVEFSGLLSPDGMEAALTRILEHGLVPVIAHVERYVPFSKSRKRMTRLRDMGCLMQINGSSLLGRAGRALRRVCLSLIKRDLVHLIASDGHGAECRTPDLREAFEFLKKKVPEERLAELMSENPTRILG
ncbi:MAG: hypothetical protein GY856_04325 [bacterium]|nr:hypothetical protein [bacterium]